MSSQNKTWTREADLNEGALTDRWYVGKNSEVVLEKKHVFNPFELDFDNPKELGSKLVKGENSKGVRANWTFNGQKIGNE